MLSIEVELLHGTIRAGSADDLVMSGEHDPGDWPPSPARVFSALVAGDGTGDRCRVSVGSEMKVLEQDSPPVVLADGRSAVLESPLLPRYVVRNEKRKEGAVQEYPARRAGLIRPGTRLAPRHPRIVYVWEDLDLEDRHLAAITARAARVGYLGCADSPVRLRVGRVPTHVDLPRWEPDPDGRAVIGVPFEGLLETLDAMYAQFSAGVNVRRSWFRADRALYRDPDDVRRDEPRETPTMLVVRFERAVSGRLSLLVSETLKAATLDLYQRYAAGPDGDVPPVLHGHGFEADRGYQLAYWLALPDVGHRHATGRLHGAAVVLPVGSEPAVIDGVRTALAHLSRLAGPGLEVAASPWAGEARPVTATPRRWLGPARVWASVTPVVQERRTKRGITLETVDRWCDHAQVPSPVDFRESPVSFLTGATRMRNGEVVRHAEDRRPASHFVLDFGEEVRGPVVLGRARQFGMGLFAPIRRGSDQ